MRNQTGVRGEKMAEEFLLQQGFKLIERNFRSRFGEIDLIMNDGNAVVFVEVKYRNTNSYGQAGDAVNFHKMRKIVKTAEHFIIKNSIKALCRFDVVSINGKIMEHIKNAFTMDMIGR